MHMPSPLHATIRRITLLGIALYASIFCGMPAGAIEAGDRILSIAPAEVALELVPGEHLEGSITATNEGRLPFRLTLEATPYHVDGDNYDPNFSTDNAYTKLKNWISFPEPECILEPGQSVAAQYIIDVPADAPSGGQYAAIMFQNAILDTNEPDSASNASTVQVQPRIAAVLYAHIDGGELRESAALTYHSLPGIVIGDTLSVASTIENDGNIDFYARQSLTIRNFFTGREITAPEITTPDPNSSNSNTASPTAAPLAETLILLPGTSRTSLIRWRLPDTGTFPIGLFRVTQTITFLDQTHTFERLLVVCPIWLALAILFLVALSVIWLILSLLKRRKTHQNNTF